MGDSTIREISFPSGPVTLAGDLVVPDGNGPFPSLLTVAGTGPQNRYGDQVKPDGTIDPHPRHRWVGERLSAAGIVQLRYDKRGVGQSGGGPREPGDPPGERDEYTNVLTDVEDAESALNFLVQQPEVDPERVVVMGTSAGAYFCCLLAARTDNPMGYILWGGLHMDIADFGDLIYNRVLEYAERGPKEREIVLEIAPTFFDKAERWPAILASARAGHERYEWKEDGETRSTSNARLLQELEYEYPKQFAKIQKPVMVIHGDQDMNVPVSEAYAAAESLREGGNPDVTLVIVPGADHGMHIAPSDLSYEDKLQLMYKTQRDFPYSEYFINSVIGWIRDLPLRN